MVYYKNVYLGNFNIGVWMCIGMAGNQKINHAMKPEIQKFKEAAGL